MEQVAKEFGIKKKLLLGKLELVKLLIFSDEHLVQEIYELNRKYELLDEIEVKKALETHKNKQNILTDVEEEQDTPEEDGPREKPTWGQLVAYSAGSWFVDTIRNTFGTKEEEDEFIRATENQNECVIKPHMTNLHR